MDKDLGDRFIGCLVMAVVGLLLTGCMAGAIASYVVNLIYG